MMKTNTRELEKCKFRAFGKMKSKIKTNPMEHFEEKSEEKKSKSWTEDNSLKELRDQQKRIKQKEMKDLSEVVRTKGATSAIFYLKEKVVGFKMTSLFPTIVKNSVTMEEESDLEAIKKASVKYVKKSSYQ